MADDRFEMADRQECTGIIAYEVGYEDRDRFLDSWTKANDILKKQAGHLGTTLHQAVSANPDFRFVNVTRWESANAFRKAIQNGAYREAAGRLDAFPIHASVYEVVAS
jgi:heme-degrading monooxygenase HmoA